MAQNGADRLRDVCRRQNRQGHLIEQRLKKVVVAAIDQRYIYRQFGQPFGRMDACKTPSNNDHTRTGNSRLSAVGRFSRYG